MDVGSSEGPVPPWLCPHSSACPISLKFQRLLLLTSPHHGPQFTSLICITRFSQPSSLLPFRVVSQRSGMSEPYHVSPMAWDSLSKSKELHRRFQNILGCFPMTFMYPHLWTWKTEEGKCQVPLVPMMSQMADSPQILPLSDFQNHLWTRWSSPKEMEQGPTVPIALFPEEGARQGQRFETKIQGNEEMFSFLVPSVPYSEALSSDINFLLVPSGGGRSWVGFSRAEFQFLTVRADTTLPRLLLSRPVINVLIAVMLTASVPTVV